MQNLYNVEPSEDGLTYTFTTRYNIKYQLALTSYSFGEVNAFSLSLYPESTPSQIDFWIKNTVIRIVGDILNKESSVIFYTCDSDDQKHHKRHAMFELWYQKSAEYFYYISKYNYELQSENGYPIIASLLYNNQNPLGDFIVESFVKAIEGI